MDHTEWVLIFGGIFAFLNAFAVGANMLANTWGTVIGSKVVTLRTAVILGIMCQIVGTTVFGPRSTPVYAGILYDWTVLKPYPGLTLYATGWTVITTVTWQFLAIWKRILIPVYLGSVASTIGAAFVFPGVPAIDGGAILNSPPFLSGLGPVFLTWVTGPMLSLTTVTLLFLLMRTCLMRGEDPFHKVLWAMPALACCCAIIWVADLIYSIGSAQGRPVVVNWSSQSVVMLLVIAGSAGCLITCLIMPHMSHKLRTRSRTAITIKRMNLLGLDEATVKDIATDEKSSDMTGWLQRAHAWLFEADLFADVAADPALLRIHSTAEEFEPAAEECFAPLQVITCMIVSIAYAANNVRTSCGIYSLMYHIHKTSSVPAAAPVGYQLRAVGAFGMVLGTLVLGARLVPVTGVQIAKMTPFRSFVVTTMTAMTLTIMALLKLKGGTITYVIVTAVTAVGLAEGSSHVNWKKVCTTMIWYVVGFAAVMVSTYALVAQGMYAPSVVSDATTTH